MINHVQPRLSLVPSLHLRAQALATLRHLYIGPQALSLVHSGMFVSVTRDYLCCKINTIELDTVALLDLLA